MNLLLAALALLLFGALPPLLFVRRPRVASAWGVAFAVVGTLVGLVAAVLALISGGEESWQLPWAMPLGSLHLGLDLLSAFFLLPLFLLGGVCAVFGRGYLGAHGLRPRDGLSWGFYNLLLVAMAVVFTARDAVLFLMAWELMALTSFALVVHEREQDQVRHAGWIYLAASQFSVAALVALFFGLSRAADGALDFGSFHDVAAGRAPLAGLLFVLAVLGFGAKAGFLTLHGWLPEAHPAAPSHVSALMSGVLIKTGIYGVVRTLTFLGPPPVWWGWLLIGIGLASGVSGVLFALAQHDLKRLLAYHSVENIGIIALGLGVGLLGMSTGSPLLTVLGFAGALLHVVNHAVFKGLLFLGAGAVWHATGTRNIEQLGGLLPRMRWTAATFLIGATAISGLPPLNGFVSEFLIYLAAFGGAATLPGGVAVPLLAVIAGLALIGGLAAACFAKAFGIIFQGEPRSACAAQAHECGWALRLPMVLLAAACVLIGLLAPWVIGALAPVLRAATGLAPETVRAQLVGATGALTWVSALAVGFFLLVGVLAVWRRWLLTGRTVGVAGTWDCGYLQPTPRMQYTAASFAEPLTRLFQPFLRIRTEGAGPAGLFPSPTARHTQVRDVVTDFVITPLFRAIAWLARQGRWLQHGRVQLYVLYIAVTLLALLLWKL